MFLEDCRICSQRAESTYPNFDPFCRIDVNVCIEAQISRCRWLTRGWTLQELITPFEIKFFDQNWRTIGTRSKFSALLSRLTGIDKSILNRTSFIAFMGDSKLSVIRRALKVFPVARKMSWAAYRQTTRDEDRAYSLLGLFEVNMPLLYGEGNKAFLRLQEEIIRHSNDDSIFAWEFETECDDLVYDKQLLASSPEQFYWCFQINGQFLSSEQFSTDLEPIEDIFEITQKTLRITVDLFDWPQQEEDSAATTSFEQDHYRDTTQLQGASRGQNSGFRLHEVNKDGKNPGVRSEISQALLGSHIVLDGSSTVRIALRLSHTYLGDRYVNSQVMCENNGRHELGEDHLGYRMGFKRPDGVHRLAFYLDELPTTMRQSIVIRRYGTLYQ